MFYLFVALALIAFAEFGFFFYLRRKARVTLLRNEESKRLYEEALVLELGAREMYEFGTKLVLSANRQVTQVTSPHAIN